MSFLSKKDDDAGVGSKEASETTSNSDGVEGQNQRQAHLAYQRIVEMLHELPDSELILLNFDVQALISRILAAAPAVMRRRSLLEPVRPFDMRYVDHSKTSASAWRTRIRWFGSPKAR
jgi:hypothetical protein